MIGAGFWHGLQSLRGGILSSEGRLALDDGRVSSFLFATRGTEQGFIDRNADSGDATFSLGLGVVKTIAPDFFFWS